MLVRGLAADARLARDLRDGHVLSAVSQAASGLAALTAAIWHNDRTGQPVRRSLLAYDHWSGLESII